MTMNPSSGLNWISLGYKRKIVSSMHSVNRERAYSLDKALQDTILWCRAFVLILLWLFCSYLARKSKRYEIQRWGVCFARL
jgi:hypothetical protein